MQFAVADEERPVRAYSHGRVGEPFRIVYRLVDPGHEVHAAVARQVPQPGHVAAVQGFRSGHEPVVGGGGGEHRILGDHDETRPLVDGGADQFDRRRFACCPFPVRTARPPTMLTGVLLGRSARLRTHTTVKAGTDETIPSVTVPGP